METRNELILRWQGCCNVGERVITIEICERQDGRFQIHLPKLQLVLSESGDFIGFESWWDATDPYRNVEDAKRDGITLAKNRAFDLFKVKFEPDEVNWVFFGDPDAPCRRCELTR
jgi:hypothetical protein